MYRNSNSIIDNLSNDIIRCMTVYRKEAYNLGRTLYMEYRSEIPAMDVLSAIFLDSYSQTRDSEYRSAISSYEDILRKYRTELSCVEKQNRDDLIDTKQTLTVTQESLKRAEEERDLEKSLHEKADEEIAFMKDRVKSLEDDYRALRDARDDDRHLISNLQEEVRRLKEENQHLKDENNRLIEEIKTLK